MTRASIPSGFALPELGGFLFRAALAATFLLLVATSAMAQHGQIRGTVTDARTGEGLPGVNVVIEGTTQGAATNVNGQYAIIGLRPDTYTLVFSFIGYQSVRVEDIRVRIDLSTTIDVQLREDILETGEIVVVAQRELVQRDLTATTAIIGADEIRALPVENFGDIVELQAGVVNGHFRGGRLGEVGYWVDGLPVQDVFDGGLALSIENEMVQEAQIVTGAFNAEYGQAMSGIVNVVTKDGTNNFEGSFSGFFGDYMTRAATLGTNLSPFPDLDTFTASAVRNAELTLSGPVLRDRLFFFASGRYFHNDGWIIGRNVFGFDDVATSEAGSLERVATPSGDSSAVALNPYDRLSGQLKLTANLGRGLRLAGNVLASREDYQDFDLGRFFFPAAQMNNRRDSYASYLKLTHALSNRTFYEAGITNNFTRFNRHLFDDPFDLRYRPSQYFDFTDSHHTSNFRVGGTDNSRFFRSTNTWLAKADVSSQLNHWNLVKVGVEARYHTIRFENRFVVVEREDDPAFREQYLFDSGSYTYNPIEFGAYAQDKIELGDLIINLGLRFDYFDAAAPVFRDPRDPDAVFPERRRCIEFDGNRCAIVDGQELVFDNPYTPDRHFTGATPKWQVSPRVGVAFPISDGGVMHFSYGHFFQRPSFELLYQNPYYMLGSGGSGLIGLVGNPDLRPEQTISGEIGLKQQLTKNSAIEVTAYYRDIRNLTGTALAPIAVRGTSVRYGQLANSDFGFVRGMILRYDQRFARDFFAGFDYTFQVARANASDPNASYGAAAVDDALIERRILPTNWDQMHTLTFSMAYNNPRLDAGVGLIATYGSGTPYTPAQVGTGGANLAPGRILLNSAIKPSIANVNLSAHKNFRFFDTHEFQLFSRVDNLLDTRNEVDVFSETGRATYSLFRNADAAPFQGDLGYLDRWYTRPGFFSQPRRVVLGLRYSL
jgi:outer membrane receptor protein involved in Fe transport